MPELRCLPNLKFCAFDLEISFFAPQHSALAGSVDGAYSALATELLPHEPQVVAICAAAFDRLQSLNCLKIMGARDSVMYEMYRDGELVHRPLMDEASILFPDIFSV